MCFNCMAIQESDSPEDYARMAQESLIRAYSYKDIAKGQSVTQDSDEESDFAVKKILIVYYSWSNGNTEAVARKLQAGLKAELVRIETVQPYTGSYDEVVQQGQDEVSRGYRPVIQPLPVNVEDYDVIAVGTPTWWYTMAPAVATFLEATDWHGKTVIPFMTNGGWPGHVIADIRKACAGANFAQPMQVKFDSTGGSQMITSETEIESWIQSLQNDAMQ